jgi:SSS family solute:Na+ symporter
MNIGWLIVIIVIYLAVIAYLGYVGFKKTKTATDYLVGGRRVNPFVMALSYGATFISTSAIVGFGGLASRFDYFHYRAIPPLRGLTQKLLTFLTLIMIYL